jgi:putative membrane protein
MVDQSKIKINKMENKIIQHAASWSALAFVFAFIFCNIASGQETPKLTDPEIASVAVVANQGDIGFAGIAQKKSKNADIISFAQTMSNDHKAVIAQAVALVKKLNVTPKDNPMSQQMVANAAKTRKMLNAKSGKDFDKAYIDNEVSYHKAVISAVENVLIPQAQNAELKGLLQQVVPTLKVHLAHAEMVQSNLK